MRKSVRRRTHALSRFNRRSPWLPVSILAGVGVSLFLFREVVGGIPGVTIIYHRDRADGTVWQLQDFLTQWAIRGSFPIMVGAYGGVRTLEDQQLLYAKGRTIKGEPPYTVDRPLGQTVTDAATNSNSAHGHAAAIDLWPVNAIGSPQFNLDDPEIMSKYEQIGAFARSLGLEWGGDWPAQGKRADYPHVQVSNWASLPIARDSVA